LKKKECKRRAATGKYLKSKTKCRKLSLNEGNISKVKNKLKEVME